MSIITWSGRMPSLRLDVTRVPGRAIIRCAGRLTFEHGAERLEEIGSDELAAGRDLVVDVEGVTELDASGLGTIARLSRCALARGRTIAVTRPSARVRCLLELSFGSLDALRLLRPAPSTALSAPAAAGLPPPGPPPACAIGG